MYRQIFNDKKADEVWVNQFGYSQSGYDVTGTLVHRNQHGEYGWHVDHIKPFSKGGTDDINNLQVLAARENEAKGDDYPTWYDTKGNKHTQY